MKMKKISRLLAAFFALSPSFAIEIENIKFDKPSDLDGWRISPANCALVKDGAFEIFNPTRAEKSASSAVKVLDRGKSAGRRVFVEADFWQNLSPSVSRWGGKIFLLDGGSKDFYVYAGKYIAPANSGWQKIRFWADTPLDSREVRVSLGVESSSGTVKFKNLRVYSEDILAEFAESANVGYAEKDFEIKAFGALAPKKVEYNASEFDTRRPEYAGVPFSMRDFHRKGDKFAVAMKSVNFPQGAEKLVADFSKISARGGFLYVLHFTAGAADGDNIGKIKLVGTDGKEKIFRIDADKNVFDYAKQKASPECISVAPWQKYGKIHTACVSKFPIPEAFGDIAKIEFTPSGAGAGTWVVLAANISERNVAFPETWDTRIVASEKWRPLPDDYATQAVKGSALDLSFLNPVEEAGARGRVIINKDGKLAFESSPDTPARFLIHIGADFREVKNKTDAENYAAALRRNGYNMVRLTPDRDLMKSPAGEGEFNPEVFDLFQYMVAQFKKNGIYIELDIMASPIGFNVGDSWNPAEKRNFKYSIYWDENVRKNWVAGMKKLLTTVNAYTKTKLAQDPQLALVICYNEQEFGLTHTHDYSHLRDKWIKFLKKKYRNKFAKLVANWGEKCVAGAENFDDLAAFTQEAATASDGRSADINAFFIFLQRDIIKWYKKQLRAAGYVGPITNFNMGKSFRDILSRKNADYVAMNNYHAHPSNFTTIGSRISQESSVGEAINISRSFASAKERGKPYVITEHGHVFWNKYRYEQGFATGAHSAFQGFDGITCFATPVSIHAPIRAEPFGNSHDATVRSQEFLTALMYLRGDVAESKYESVVKLDEKDITGSKAMAQWDGMDASQSRLSLLTKLSVASSKFEPRENETVFERMGGSSLILHAGYTNITDTQHSDFDLSSAVADMRARGILDKNNRTDVAAGIFESSTDEIYLDTNRKYMTVNTARTQGMSAPAGSTADLRDVKIAAADCNANITITSVDGKAPIAKAKRLVLVLAPNSLNSDMVFDGAEMTNLINMGRTPLLIETGKYKITLKNENWKKMRLFALNMDGSRSEELKLKKANGALEIIIDTAKTKIPSVYYELVDL